MDDNFEKTKYCGVWLNNPADLLCEKLANKAFHDLEKYRYLKSVDEQILDMQQWNKQYTTKYVLVYCNGCEKGIKLGEGHPIHIIDLIAGIL